MLFEVRFTKTGFFAVWVQSAFATLTVMSFVKRTSSSWSNIPYCVLAASFHSNIIVAVKLPVSISFSFTLLSGSAHVNVPYSVEPPVNTASLNF